MLANYVFHIFFMDFRKFCDGFGMVFVAGEKTIFAATGGAELCCPCLNFTARLNHWERQRVIGKIR